MGKSGKFKASNDAVIKNFLEDGNYKVLKNGTILTRLDRGGHVTNKWREATLSKKTSNENYLDLAYQKHGIRKRLSVHRIVYAAFHGPLDSELVVNHIDGNPSNNHYKNLELITMSDNNIHRFQVLGHKGVKGNTKISQEIADQLRRDHKAGLSYSRLMKKYKLSKSTISYAVRGLTWNDDKKEIKNFHPAKLDQIQADEIKALRDEGLTYKAIAQKYSVSKTTVIKICLGKSYKTA